MSPAEKDLILGFLAWAAENGFHLASHGRPPFGTKGTWFMGQFEHPGMVEKYLAHRKEQSDGVRRTEVQPVREVPEAPGSGEERP